MARPTYAEFLKSQGASAEDIKALTEGPSGQAAVRAFDALQAQLERESAARITAETAKQQYDDWFRDEATPEYKRMEQELIVSKANEAKARAAIEAARNQGLADIAKELGYDVVSEKKADQGNVAAPNFDPNKYLTREEILQIAEREGDAIALAQDIAAEHRVLFPDKPLNFRELRKQAVAAKKPVEQFWMETYGVAAAREARAKSEEAANIAKWKAEGAKEKETELVSKFGNPDTRPLSASRSPFAARPQAGRDKQPWEAPDRSDERVRTVAQKLVSQTVQ